jgi:hypothetical protein
MLDLHRRHDRCHTQFGRDHPAGCAGACRPPARMRAAAARLDRCGAGGDATAGAPRSPLRARGRRATGRRSGDRQGRSSVSLSCSSPKLRRQTTSTQRCVSLIQVSAAALSGDCLSPIEKSKFVTDRNVTDGLEDGSARRIRHFIDLMVERAATGEAPSSPKPPEAGAARPGFTASRPPQTIGTESQFRRPCATPMLLPAPRRDAAPLFVT